MRDEIRSIDVSNRAVRGFGFLMGAIALVVALWITWKAGWEPPRTALLTAAGGFVVAALGLALPALLRPVYRLWMMLAVVLGFVMTRVILTIVFYAIVTPIGLLMCALGRDPLAKRPDPAMDSYWIPVERGAETRVESAERLRRYY